MKYTTAVVVALTAIVLSSDAVSSWEHMPKSHGKGRSRSSSSSSNSTRSPGGSGKGKGGGGGSGIGRLGGGKGGKGGSKGGGSSSSSSHSRSCKKYGERCSIDAKCCGDNDDTGGNDGNGHPELKCVQEYEHSAYKVCSEVPTPVRCPAVAVEAAVDYETDCYTGNFTEVRDLCVENDNACCVDPADNNATEAVCNWEGTATVCPGSCLGKEACSGLGRGTELGGNNTIKIGPDSCISDFALACVGLLGSVGAGSCRGGACAFANGPIGSGSCLGLKACGLDRVGEIGEVSGIVGDCSCLFEESCTRRPSVGSGSCQVQNVTEDCEAEGLPGIPDDTANCTKCRFEG